MPPASVLDTPHVGHALERSADPDAARALLERLLEVRPALSEELVAHDLVLDGLVAIACASRALSNALVSDTALVDVLLDERGITVEQSVADYRAIAESARDDGDPRRGLRRFKRRQYLRVAVRDLLGRADLPTVGRELAALAEACLREVLATTRPTIAFAVIGMGKLGGTELNYASDVDVLFVHDGDAALAERCAREVLAAMGEPSADGIVFRTDADLRPEGRAGPLTRSLESYAAHYEHWARNWEYQALIKARPVAGDLELAASFMALTRPYVWPDVLDPDAVREVRTMKARAEAETDRRGVGDRELKRGRGGIRDIEFAVQLLQLVHGRHDESIRSATTLEALEQLTAAGYVERDDASRLQDAYRFLRTVEHRLQLWEEQQTHTIPSDETARTRLARVLGYRATPEASALERFEAEHRSRQATVRSIHERLFFAPILDTLAGAGPLSPQAAEERLIAFGFADAAHTRAALAELTHGFTRTSRLMQQLLPVVLDWLSTAPDPDLGLLQLRRLVEGPTRSAALATTFRESPVAAERVCRVLGASRLLGDALWHQPDFVEALADDDQLLRERTTEDLVDTALETLQWRADPAQRRQGLRRFKRRELLRIATRDVLGLATLPTTSRELAALADACVEAALSALAPRLAFAVVGMGRLGGHELSYASDIDVLFVYDGDDATDFAEAERVATGLMAEIGETTAEGQTFRIDANLRPEGKQGALARSLEGYRSYYEHNAFVWEVQALLRARHVAGSSAVTTRFLELVEPIVYRDPFPEEAVREVRRVKARVERERITPGEDSEFHLKLGRGALTDVEFTVQLLQLLHGARNPGIRATATTDALRRLRDERFLDSDDASILEESFGLCERARNARYLVTGKPGDALPTGREALHIARLLGYVHRPEASLRDDYRRVTRRARRVVERVFYGQP